MSTVEGQKDLPKVDVSYLDIGSFDPVSDGMLKTVTIVNYAFLIGVISVTGVVLNIINIAVFLKQGFKDPINIPLVGLAVADTGGLVCLIWMSLCYNPLVVGSLERLDLVGIQHITAGWPHVCFTRITGWLTVFITFERYLCIAFPLKVKAILTPRRTAIIVVVIFIVLILTVVPVYIAIYIDRVFSSKYNRTLFTIVYIQDGVSLEKFSLYCSTFLQLSSFVLVAMLTTGLVVKITQKSKWRIATSSANQNEAVSSRDRKVVRMVIFISGIFILSFTPVVIHMLAMLSVADFIVGGRYQNLFLLCGTFVFNLQAINSSANIFVYLKMSSKFKDVFMSMFCNVKKQ
ncbi:ultraviolet-sensitive opsin-like [Physella acuta]|uniref:ultraviolet-sensitive opsin-like n=1 Tax=Physella acuta TaxID=109671 RepID=UPI0027DAFC21|nr:ultraviolet-sensitive opsin-like [Physella acuta]